MVRTIVFEGLMCTGKTTAIKHCSESVMDVLVVPETMHDDEVDAIPPFRNEGSESYYIQNDFAKSAKIAASRCRKILVDRYFVSTVAYQLTLAGERPSRAVVDARIRKYYLDTTPADLWIMVECDPAVSLARAQVLKPNQLFGCWTQTAQVQRIQDFMLFALDAIGKYWPQSRRTRIASDDLQSRLDWLQDEYFEWLE